MWGSERRAQTQSKELFKIQPFPEYEFFSLSKFRYNCLNSDLTEIDRLAVKKC